MSRLNLKKKVQEQEKTPFDLAMERAQGYSPKLLDQVRRMSFREFIPAIATLTKTSLIVPEHFRELIDLLEDISLGKKSKQYWTISAPPRHGKSTLLLYYILYMAIKHPGIRIMYASYGEKFSLAQSQNLLMAYRELGGTFYPGQQFDWNLGNGSFIYWRSTSAPVTGLGANLLICDDLIKDSEQANSEVHREKTWDWLRSVALTRLEPNASAIVCATRWHVDDVIGRLKALPISQWKHLNYPALVGNKALYPSRYSVDDLNNLKSQLGEYIWQSLYQGNPQVQGAALFETPTFYEPQDLPPVYRISVGADLAYTQSRRADYSAMVALAHTDTNTYILEAFREKLLLKDMKPILEKWQAKYNVPITFCASSMEATLLGELPIKKQIIDAKKSKFERALPAAIAWNSGKMRFPAKGVTPALKALLDEVTTFTGIEAEGIKDDCVDALSTAYNGFSKTKAKPWVVVYDRFMAI